MASYESDSSLDDAPDYTETNVLLGYASKDPTDDLVSHLGGHPVGGTLSTRDSLFLTDALRPGLIPMLALLPVSLDAKSVMATCLSCCS